MATIFGLKSLLENLNKDSRPVFRDSDEKHFYKAAFEDDATDIVSKLSFLTEQTFELHGY